MNLREFLDTVRLYRKTFAAAFLTVLALGVAWLVLAPLPYVSTAQLLVSVNGSATANAYQNDSVVAGRVNSYVALLTSEAPNQRVVDKLGLKMTPAQLAKKISAVQVPPNTAIIDIAVTDSSPDRARLLAGAVADEFVVYTQSLESPTGVDAQRVQTSVVSPAGEARSRLTERIVIGALIVVLALLAGAVAVWIRAAADPVVREPQQARKATDLPVLAVASAGDAGSPQDLEPYLRLRASLKGIDGPVIEVSPAGGDADATQIAMNLGRAMVAAGDRCIVVDATDGAGSATVSAGEHGEPDIMSTTDVRAAVERVGNVYQRIIIATSPVLSDVSASNLSEHASAVVLVVPLGRSRRADVRQAADNLAAVGAQVAGLLPVR